MIIALWGASATAKTTVGKQISNVLRAPIRSCGDEIREAAKRANVPLAAAPDELHREIDDLTQKWAFDLSEGVVEGRFLDQVLAARSDVVLVRLTCEFPVRLERWIGRAGKDFDSVRLAEMDKADDLFRVRMYGHAVRGGAQLTLDTSVGEVDEWTEKILTSIG